MISIRIRSLNALCLALALVVKQGDAFQAIQPYRLSSQPPLRTSPVTLQAVPTFGILDKLRRKKKKPVEDASICIIGGGVAGLVAASEAAKALKPSDDVNKIILLEASESLGGRVQSDKTDDGFVLDRGFAVFIEEYPKAKQLLDYDKLGLGKFQPGGEYSPK